MSWATGYTPGYGLAATVVTLTYLWLPYMVIPFAAFERVPDSPVDASSIWAPPISRRCAWSWHRWFRYRGRFDLHLLAVAKRLHRGIVGGKTQMLGNIIYGQLVTANTAASGAVDHSRRDHRILTGDAPHRRVGERLMLSSTARRAVWRGRYWSWYSSTPHCFGSHQAFNASRSFAFPPTGFTLQWWVNAANSEGMWKSLANSVVVGLGATIIALVLGTMAAFAVQRYVFFGRNVVSFLVVLPITLPGIVTGIALNATFTSALGVTLGMATVIVGHATFCIVIVFNNTQARLRRLGTSLDDASADLGASPWQTFRYVTFPMMRGALVAGAILAFALSFDEIVVTTFTAGPTVQTLPIWIFGNLFRPNQAPVINVVAAALTIVAIIPVWLAQRFGGDPATTRV